jgi:tetratricopeptide (TPR) repeat protein
VLARGLADYREGQYARAVERLKSLAPDPEGIHRDTTTYLVLGMAHQRLGQAAEARQALDRARAILEQKYPKPDRGDLFPGDWQEWLRCQILRREAEALIEGKSAEAKPKG